VAADEGQAGERGDVLKRDGGLALGEDEGIGGPRPERRELELLDLGDYGSTRILL
jgi:hypothetical protein